jgi:hypothetical protein
VNKVSGIKEENFSFDMDYPSKIHQNDCKILKRVIKDASTDINTNNKLTLDINKDKISPRNKKNEDHDYQSCKY